MAAAYPVATMTRYSAPAAVSLATERINMHVGVRLDRPGGRCYTAKEYICMPGGEDNQYG